MLCLFATLGKDDEEKKKRQEMALKFVDLHHEHNVELSLQYQRVYVLTWHPVSTQRDQGGTIKGRWIVGPQEPHWGDMWGGGKVSDDANKGSIDEHVDWWKNEEGKTSHSIAFIETEANNRIEAIAPR